VNIEDHAIVVGVSRYPGFGRTHTEPRDLVAPDDDADRVGEWLRDPGGGGLPADNVKLIQSRQKTAISVLDAEPQKETITREFRRLDLLAQENNAKGQGLRVGRRLYVYMSGHGFAPRRRAGALFVASATRQQTEHVYASEWAEWFQMARYFDEFVLWMDCCMTFDLTITPEAAGFRRVNPSGVLGPFFSGFAARFPLQAVERQMPDGRIHGVFTWTLLQGLRGGATDATMNPPAVTSASLKKYLVNNMRAFMTEEDRKDESISKEPDFGSDDPMTFAVFPDVPKFPVIVRAPAAEGKVVKVLSGPPLKVVSEGKVVGGEYRVDLPNGLYFAKVEELGLVHEFETVGGRDNVVTIT